MDLDQKALALKGEKTPFCWATVVKVSGSAPRHVGAKMLVTKKASFGTIGGGSLEHLVIKDAREILRQRGAELKRYELEAGAIQPCGGEVEIFLEPILPQLPIVVFGAGHIGEKLCPMLCELGFAVTLVDERAERLALPAFDQVPHKLQKLPADAIAGIDFTDDLHLISITHKHSHDEEIVRLSLGRPFRYLGLISSKAKWALFRKHLRETGHKDAELARVAVPIGLDIGAETPFEIAVAIAAQLIQLSAKHDDFAQGVCHFPKELS